MKKLIYTSTGMAMVFTICSAALSAQINPVNNPAHSSNLSKKAMVTVTINNNSSIPISQARIKIGATNTWKELGALQFGNNFFVIPKPTKGDNGGIVEVQLSNGQWLISIYKNPANKDSIQLILGPNDTNGLSLLTNASERSQPFSPIPAQDKDAKWKAGCKVEFDELPHDPGEDCMHTDEPLDATITCDIDSDPVLQFSGKGKFAHCGGTADGWFGSGDVSPAELANTTVKSFGVEGTPIYTHLNVSPHGYFNSTEDPILVTGAGTDARYVCVNDDCKLPVTATLHYKNIDFKPGVTLCVEDGNCTSEETGDGSISLPMKSNKFCVHTKGKQYGSTYIVYKLIHDDKPGSAYIEIRNGQLVQNHGENTDYFGDPGYGDCPKLG